MKRYRTLGMVEWTTSPSNMRWALEAGDPTATDIVEVETVKATRSSVWVKYDNGDVVRYKRHNGAWSYFDTEEEAREAIHKYVNARIDEVERLEGRYRVALVDLHLGQVVK